MLVGAAALVEGLGSRARVREVLALTGLTDVAFKRAGGFSLGMGQRLGIAAALLGDPKTILLDEPVNGLDPEGVQWVRHLARSLAADGRAVFLSSHLMSEMAQTADHLLVIGRGSIIADASVQDVLAANGQRRTIVRADSQPALCQALTREGVSFTVREPQLLEVNAEPRLIAWLAREADALIYELTPKVPTLEEAYMELTKNDVEYRSGGLTTAGEATR